MKPAAVSRDSISLKKKKKKKPTRVVYLVVYFLERERGFGVLKVRESISPFSFGYIISRWTRGFFLFFFFFFLSFFSGNEGVWIFLVFIISIININLVDFITSSG